MLRNRTRQPSLSVLPQPPRLTEQTLTECGILTCLCTWTIPSLKTEPNSNNKNFSCTVSVLFSSSICLWIFLWYWVPSFLLVPCLSLFIYILQILRPLSSKTSRNLDANFIFLLKLIVKANRIFCLVYQNGSSSVIFPLCSCWLYIHHDRFQL